MSFRRHAKVDANHGEIVAALRAIGCSVQSLAPIGKGCPDLLVGRRGKNYLLEVKDGSLSPSKRKLTADENKWHSHWSGSIKLVENVDDAIYAVQL